MSFRDKLKHCAKQALTFWGKVKAGPVDEHGYRYKEVRNSLTGKLDRRWTYAADDLKKEHAIFFEKFYQDGQLKERDTMQGGQCIGPYQIYYRSGQLMEQGVYKDLGVYAIIGNIHGVVEQYHENGQLKARYNYWCNQKDGPFETYNEEGQLIEKGVYCHNRQVFGKEAEDYLREWQAQQDKAEAETKRQKREKALEGIKEKLDDIDDLEKIKKSLRLARTPKRMEEAARIVRVRRAKEILSSAAQKAQKAGKQEELQEIVEIAKPYAAREAAIRKKFHKKRLDRRTKKDR